MNKNTKIILGILVILVFIGLGFFFLKSGSSSTTPPTSTLPTTTPVSNGKTYTLAGVSTHTGAASCWTTISGKVYDVTTWIDQHPGGRDAILSLCGKDGTLAFTNQHGGQARPASELATFYVGDLATTTTP